MYRVSDSYKLQIKKCSKVFDILMLSKLVYKK